MQAMARRSGVIPYKWIVASVVVFGIFMSVLDSTIVNIAIPSLQNAFGASLNDVQWVLTGYTLAQGVATPLTGYLVDLMGTKRLYLFALTIFTCFSAMCSLAWSLPALIFFRLLQGAGGAFLGPISITLLYSEFPPQERGMAMGALGIPILVAPALGPTLGGYLVTYASWQFIFWINVPIGCVAFLLAATLLHEIPREGHAHLDIPGLLFSAAGLGAILYAFSDASTDGWSSQKVLTFLIGGLIALSIFVVVELDRIHRGKQPLLDLRNFGDRAFTSSSIASMFVVFILFGGLLLLPLYLQTLRGLSAFQAGLFLLPQALTSMVVVLVGGRLSDKFGTKAVVIPGLLILIIPLWGLMNLTQYSPYGWFQLLLIMRGGEIGLVMQPLMRSALVTIPRKQLAQASSLLTVNRFISASFITAIIGTLVQTQQKIHYTHLAEQVVPGTPKGQLLSIIQTHFLAMGMNIYKAQQAAILEMIQIVQHQAYALALQDGYRITFLLVIPAIVAVLFIPSQRIIKTKTMVPGQPDGQVGDETSEEAMAAMVG
jgi:EmrB/QacA subfamily drug resistance transporter